ncbi:MAG: hypothetical protein ACFB5Z_09520 [Elainellaceae cyanobacterium]
MPLNASLLPYRRQTSHQFAASKFAVGNLLLPGNLLLLGNLLRFSELTRAYI